MSSGMAGPIFIVGASRCGTELARSVLNQHSQIHISGESHWFDDHRPRLRNPSGEPCAREARDVVAYLLSVRGHGYGMRDGAVDPEAEIALRQRWGSVGVSADAAFAANCMLQADMRGKIVWGEKTPRHIYRVSEILKAFPEARILVCLRDPRAAVSSYRDWSNNWFDRTTLDVKHLRAVEAEEKRVRRSYSLTVATLMWRSAVRTGLRLRERFGPERVYVLRFETMLTDPDQTCRSLARWIGLPFEHTMLDVAVTNSSYVLASNSVLMDRRAVDRWRQRLSTDEARYIGWLTRREIRILGYHEEAGIPGKLFIARQLSLASIQIMRALLANRKRIGNFGEFILARLTLSR